MLEFVTGGVNVARADVNIKNIARNYRIIYNTLYNSRYGTDNYSEAIDCGDSIIHQEPEFVDAFGAEINDAVTSDREVAAMAYAVTETLCAAGIPYKNGIRFHGA